MQEYPTSEITLKSAIELHAMGNIKSALVMYKRLMNQPHGLDGHLLHYYGLALFQEGPIKLGLLYMLKAYRTDKRNFDFTNNLVFVLNSLKRFSLSRRLCEKLLDLRSDKPEIYLNLGLANKGLKKFNEAKENFIKFSEHFPDDWRAPYNLGVLFFDSGAYEQAIHSFLRALKLNSNAFDIFLNLGTAYFKIWKYSEAERYLVEANKRARGNQQAAFNLAQLHIENNRFRDALFLLESILDKDSQFPFAFSSYFFTKMRVCNWNNYQEESSALIEGARQGNLNLNPFSLMSVTDDLSLLQKTSSRWIEKYMGSRHSNVQVQGLNMGQEKVFDAENIARIKLGYFSSDFHDHATLHLAIELFEMHNKADFEVFAFSYGKHSSDILRRRAEGAFEHFIDISGMSDTEVVVFARSLGLDVAVDLKGYTQRSRPGIFFDRVAPIQISFLGYPGTLGGIFMDYAIADHYVVPESARRYYSEEVVDLSGGYQPRRKRFSGSRKSVTRSHYCLPKQALVYCCFNNSYKITPAIFGIWTEIVAGVSDSVLWVLADNQEVRDNLRREFAEQGLNEARLIFADRVGVEEHLSRHILADVFLDTFPYGAHTSARDCLSMSLPIVTLCGESFSSRVAASLLDGLGLADLISTDLDGYKQTAIRLGNDPAYLEATRGALETNLDRMGFFDPKIYVDRYEQLLKKIHATHRALRVSH
jgi:predicted O-linked N-acetylglucosamine transferase (SPINDLY family)